jgi:ribose 5-phosphate isomerase B
MDMTMVANKVHGYTPPLFKMNSRARCAREDYHCNIISIGGDLVGGKEIHKFVEVFLPATVAVGRHAKRIEKLKQVEELLAQAPRANRSPLLASPD